LQNVSLFFANSLIADAAARRIAPKLSHLLHRKRAV